MAADCKGGSADSGWVRPHSNCVMECAAQQQPRPPGRPQQRQPSFSMGAGHGSPSQTQHYPHTRTQYTHMQANREAPTVRFTSARNEVSEAAASTAALVDGFTPNTG